MAWGAASPVPPHYRGVWVRRLLESPQGRDETTSVHWLQASVCHADLRIPAGEPRSTGAASTRAVSSGEFDSVRPYRRGDPLKAIVWKKAAKTDELVSRDSQQSQAVELWLDLALAGGGALEQRLARLCAWVLAAEESEVDYGLRLPSLELSPSHGELHKRRCLEALALF